MSAAIEDPVASVLKAPLEPLRHGGLGFVGPDVSMDLLIASGRAFGHLPWHAGISTPFADGVLESGFPGWSRSILEQWHQGAFDGLHAVVFSRSDDASQRLYYYVRELQRRGQLRGPRPLMLDLALVPRASSLDHSAAAVASLAQELEISEPALRGGIARADALRLKLQRLQQQRSSAGVLHERLGRALLWSDPLRWLDSLRLPAPGAARRVLLVGSTPPDERLHAAVENADACVVAETHVHAIGRLGLPLDAAEASAARHVARQQVLTATGPRAFLDRAQWITRLAHEARAAAVILWLTREDEALAWHVPAMQRALAAADVPALVLPAASWRADDGALERIASFCRGAAR
jgi:hypothetical protein